MYWRSIVRRMRGHVRWMRPGLHCMGQRKAASVRPKLDTLQLRLRSLTSPRCCFPVQGNRLFAPVLFTLRRFMCVHVYHQITCVSDLVLDNGLNVHFYKPVCPRIRSKFATSVCLVSLVAPPHPPTCLSYKIFREPRRLRQK